MASLQFPLRVGHHARQTHVVLRAADGAPVAWRYDERGVDRQKLVNVVVVAVSNQTLQFAPGLAGMDAMTKAMTSYRRTVGVDGTIGSELVVALALALLPRLLPIRHWAGLA